MLFSSVTLCSAFLGEMANGMGLSGVMNDMKDPNGLGGLIGGMIKDQQPNPVETFIDNMGTPDETAEKIGLGPLLRNTRSMNATHDDQDTMIARLMAIHHFNEMASKIIVPVVDEVQTERQRELNALLKTAIATAKEIRILHDREFPAKKDRKIFIVPKTSREKFEKEMDTLAEKKNLQNSSNMPSKQQCAAAFYGHEATKRAMKLSDPLEATIEAISSLPTARALGSSTHLLAAVKLQMARLQGMRDNDDMTRTMANI